MQLFSEKDNIIISDIEYIVQHLKNFSDIIEMDAKY